jgi:hypothetical protein
VDRSEDMRIFAKVVESGSFAGAAARLNIAASKLRHPVSSPPPLGARHRMRPAETEDIVYQGSRIAVPPPRTEGVACKQPALECGVGRRARE